MVQAKYQTAGKSLIAKNGQTKNSKNKGIVAQNDQNNINKTSKDDQPMVTHNDKNMNNGTNNDNQRIVVITK